MAVKMKQVGEWSFLGGVLLAILAGFLTLPYVPLLLVVLGFLVGLLNVTEKETVSFLVAAIALLLVGSAGLGTLFSVVGLETLVDNVLANLRVFVAPAVLVVALKAVFDLTKKR